MPRVRTAADAAPTDHGPRTTAHARHGPCPWSPRSDAAAGARPRCRHGDTDRAHGAHRFRVTTHLRMHARRCEYRRGRLPSVHMFSRTRLSLPLRLRHVTGCTHAASSDATCVDTDEPLSLSLSRLLQGDGACHKRNVQHSARLSAASRGGVATPWGQRPPARASTHTRTKTRNKRSCLTASAASRPAPPHSHTPCAARGQIKLCAALSAMRDAMARMEAIRPLGARLRTSSSMRPSS